VRGGMLGTARLLMALEEHDRGQQLVRFRAWPRLSPEGLMVIALFLILSVGATIDGAGPASAILGLIGVLLASRALLECAGSLAAIVRALRQALGED